MSHTDDNSYFLKKQILGDSISLSRVILHTVILLLSLLLLLCFLDVFNLSFFSATASASLADTVREGDIITISLFAFIFQIPLIMLEELIFRKLPFMFWRKYWNNSISFWIVGGFAALLFAEVHVNFVTTGLRLPLAQLILGLYLWHVIAKRNGYKLAVFSHFLYNTILLIGSVTWMLVFGR